MQMSKNSENTISVKYDDFEILYEYKKQKCFYVIKSNAISVSYNNFHRSFIIPCGFKSDGCTIPKIFKPLIGCSHTSKFIAASIIHDFLLNYKNIITDKELESLIFKEVLIKEGVKPAKAQIMFIAVELWRKIKEIKEYITEMKDFML